MNDRPSPKLKMTTVPFAEWRRGIAPLWLRDGTAHLIAHTIDGGGQMQYFGRERAQSVICFPIACEYDGERVGWTSIYNVSDEAVRIRGIYVLPEFRSNAIGYHMVNYAMSLWPEPWRWAYMYARTDNVERYLKWGFTVPRDHIARHWAEGARLGAKQVLLMRKPLNQS